ncbi:MAG: alpha/beta hydrolase-fold protein [Nitrospirota bacterium]
MKFKSSNLLLILSLSLSLGAASAFAHGEKMDVKMDEGEAARARIEKYISTRDDKEADEILEHILSHPILNIDQILIQLKRWKRYEEEKKGPLFDQKLAIGSGDIKYALYVPEGYSSQIAYPLIVCLHGAGFDGNRYLERWSARLGESYIVLCPSVEGGTWWTDEAASQVISLIEDVKERYNIDTNRIFLTGMSNGGVGALRIGIYFPDRFAGVAPMAGAMPVEAMPFLKNLKNTPVYIIHGSKDQVMPVEYSRKISNRLQDLGYDVVYKEHDMVHPQAGGHFFPAEELPELIKWLGGKRRDPYPKELTFRVSGTGRRGYYWVTIDEMEEGKEGNKSRVLFTSIETKVIDGNRIEVKSEKVKTYTLFLNDKIVDLSKDVTIVTNGKVSFEGHIKKDPSILLKDARSRQDREMLFPATITIKVD